MTESGAFQQRQSASAPFSVRPESRASGRSAALADSSDASSRVHAQQREAQLSASDVYHNLVYRDHAESQRRQQREVRSRNFDAREAFDEGHRQLREALSAYDAEQQRIHNDRALYAHHAKFANMLATAARIRNDRLSRIARRNHTKQLLEESGHATMQALADEQRRRGLMTASAANVVNTSAVRERSVLKMLQRQHDEDARRRALHPTVEGQLLHSLQSPMCHVNGKVLSPLAQQRQLPHERGLLPPRPLVDARHAPRSSSSRGTNGLTSTTPSSAVPSRRSTPGLPAATHPSRLLPRPALGDAVGGATKGIRDAPSAEVPTRPSSRQSGGSGPGEALPAGLDDGSANNNAESRLVIATRPSPMRVDDPFPEVAQHAKRVMHEHRKHGASRAPKDSIHAQKAARESRLFIRHVVEEARRSHRMYREVHRSPVRVHASSSSGILEGALRVMAVQQQHDEERSLLVTRGSTRHSIDGHGAGSVGGSGDEPSLMSQSNSNASHSMVRRLSEVHYAFSQLNKSKSQLEVASTFAQSWIASFRGEQLERQRVADERHVEERLRRQRAVEERNLIPPQPTDEELLEGVPGRERAFSDSSSDGRSSEADNFEVIPGLGDVPVHQRGDSRDQRRTQPEVCADVADAAPHAHVHFVEDPFPPPPPGQGIDAGDSDSDSDDTSVSTPARCPLRCDDELSPSPIKLVSNDDGATDPADAHDVSPSCSNPSGKLSPMVRSLAHALVSELFVCLLDQPPQLGASPVSDKDCAA